MQKVVITTKTTVEFPEPEVQGPGLGGGMGDGTSPQVQAQGPGLGGGMGDGTIADTKQD